MRRPPSPHCGGRTLMCHGLASGGPALVAILQQVGGERVPEGVRGDVLREARGVGGPAKLLLDHRLVAVVPVLDPGMAIPVMRGRRKDPLPAPLAIGTRVFPPQRARQRYAAETASEVELMETANRVEMDGQLRHDGGR